MICIWLYVQLYPWDLCFHMPSMALFSVLIWRTLLSLFGKAGPVMTNSLSLCLGKTLPILHFFLPPSFLRRNFVRYRILVWHLFPFRTWNISSHYLLTWKVFAGKSTDNPMGLPFCVTVFKILSLSMILDNLIIMCLGELVGWPWLGLLGFMNLDVI